MSAPRPGWLPASALLWWLGAAAPAAAGATSPSLPARHAPAADAAEGGLWMASREAEEVVAHSPRRVRDPALETYLREVTCRLAAEYCADLRVYLVRVPYFNASMLPNGALQVWTGLLLRVHDEAQLAAILGHELGHYLRRHSLQRFEDIQAKSTLLTLFTLGLSGAVAAGGVAPSVAQGASTAAQIGTLGSVYAFSRDHESEADAFGLQLMARAGYDPAAAALVWSNLVDEESAGEPATARGTFFATHPSPANRLAALRAAATQQVDGAPMPGDEARARYSAAVGPHLRQYLDDELQLNQPAQSGQLLQRLLDAGFAPGTAHYYLGEVERRRDGGASSEAALAHYEAALRHPDAPPETHRALGVWMLKAKRMPAARDHLSTYLRLVPKAPDRRMIEYYLELTERAP
jgi:predicted Zn-dependent protease